MQAFSGNASAVRMKRREQVTTRLKQAIPNKTDPEKSTHIKRSTAVLPQRETIGTLDDLDELEKDNKALSALDATIASMENPEEWVASYQDKLVAAKKNQRAERLKRKLLRHANSSTTRSLAMHRVTHTLASKKNQQKEPFKKKLLRDAKLSKTDVPTADRVTRAVPLKKIPMHSTVPPKKLLVEHKQKNSVVFAKKRDNSLKSIERSRNNFRNKHSQRMDHQRKNVSLEIDGKNSHMTWHSQLQPQVRSQTQSQPHGNRSSKNEQFLKHLANDGIFELNRPLLIISQGVACEISPYVHQIFFKYAGSSSSK